MTFRQHMVKAVVWAATGGMLVPAIPVYAQDTDIEIHVRLPRDLVRSLTRAVDDSTKLATDIADEIARSVTRNLDPVLQVSSTPGAQRQNRDSRVEREDRSTRTIPLGPTGTLELKAVSGDITVTAGSGRDVVLEVVRRSRGQTEADAARGLQEVQVAVDHRGERASVSVSQATRGRLPYQVTTTYTVTAPAGTRVTAATVSGNVTIRDIKGEVAVEVTSGNVAIRGGSKVSQVQSISGNVTLTDIDGDSDVNAKAISGDVELQRVRAGRLAVDVVSGHVRAVDVTCQSARLTSLAGTLEYGGPLARSGRYELNSHSGEVRFVAYGPVGFELQATTFSGRIRPDPGFALQSSRLGRGSLRATAGDGSAVVVLQTFSGDVVIGKK